MMFSIMRNRIAAIALALISAISIQSVNAATMASDNSRWTKYTSFDSQPYRIIDGERYTYFLVHQTYFNPSILKDWTGTGYVSSSQGGLLYYDKQNPASGIRALHDCMSLNGSDVRFASYNPAGRYLLIIYADGGIELLYDNGTQRYYDDLCNPTLPFSALSSHVSFPLDSHDAWIATEQGYIHIDGLKNTLEYVNLGQRLKGICPVGNRLVAIVETVTTDKNGAVTATARSIYDAPMDGAPKTFADFKMTAISGLNNMEAILPMSADALLTMSGNNVLLVKRNAAGVYSRSTLFADNTLSNQLHLATNDPGTPTRQNKHAYLWSVLENNLIPTASGYLIFSKTHAYCINKGLDGNGNAGFVKKKFATDYPAWTSTTDFTNFWFYEYRKGFYRSTVSGEGDAAVWTASTPMSYNGPTGFELAKLHYSSKYGMLVRNNTLTAWKGLPGFSNTQPMLLSGLRNGVWTNYSPVYGTPDCVQDNESWKTAVENAALTATAYPLSDPIDACFDTNFPDYMFLGSAWQGVNAVKLNNVNGQVMRFVAENHSAFQELPGLKRVFPRAGWGSLAISRPMGVDNKGTLWVNYDDYTGYAGKGYAIFLYYWTLDARKKAMETQDVANGGEWGSFYIPTPFEMSSETNYPVVLKHPSNNDRLAIAFRAEGEGIPAFGPIVLIDTKGTPGDTSDDKVDFIYSVQLPGGNIINLFSYAMGLMEDPLTGNLIYSCTRETLIIDISKPVVNNVAQGDYFAPKTADGSGLRPTAGGGCTAVTVDEYNRIWYSPNMGGVAYTTPDRSRVEAHYTTDNSPLPSNAIYDLCWNPETKEMMMTTQHGLVSVKAPASATSASASAPFLSPAAVTPGSASFVTLHNAPSRAGIDVYDAEGRKVKGLTRNDGLFVWDTCDEQGRLVPTGVYTFRDYSGEMKPISVNILR